MMSRRRKPPVDVRGPDRRAFLKWSLGAGVALGLPPWRIFESVEGSAGVAAAQELACATTNRSLHIIAGDGGHSWFQLLWPHVDIALAKKAGTAFHDFDNAQLVAGSDKPLVVGPEAPWRSL